MNEVGVTDIVPDVVMSADSKHGEYTTNVAMRLAKPLKKSPMDIALQVKTSIEKRVSGVRHKIPDQKNSKPDQKNAGNVTEKNTLQDKDNTKLSTSDILSSIDRIEIAPPGFINVFLKDVALSSQVREVLKDGERYGKSQSGKGKHLMVEYTDPNPFKELHIGHLYSNAVGESLARLYAAIGWDVSRVDYFGDVGMHVAKSIWGLRKKMAEDHVTLAVLESKPLPERVQYLGQAYAKGATIYEEKTPEAEKAKEEMKDINYMVYLAAQEYMEKALKWTPQVDYRQYVQVDDTLYQEVKELYEKGRTWSMDYFETIFRRLGTHFDAYYPESIVGEYGAKLVREHIGKVFEESDGAVVFRGESSKAGLHTRVFLNSLGLPTYEAKELGLNWKKSQDYALDKSFIVTGNEINEYFKVLFAAMEQVIPEIGAKTKHIGHGMVRNADGSKMSSRTGNVLTGVGMLEEVKKSIYEILDKSESSSFVKTSEDKEEIAEKGAIAAVKYSLLRVALPSNVSFSIATSISFDGDSGPYLLYTYARCKSVLRKASSASALVPSSLGDLGNLGDVRFNEDERALARLIHFFPEIVAAAAHDLAPNVICTYLFDLAQSFNTFYQKHQIIEQREPSSENRGSMLDTRYSNFRLVLTAATAQVLQNGLNLLGISTVERM